MCTAAAATQRAVVMMRAGAPSPEQHVGFMVTVCSRHVLRPRAMVAVTYQIILARRELKLPSQTIVVPYNVRGGLFLQHVSQDAEHGRIEVRCIDTDGP